ERDHGRPLRRYAQSPNDGRLDRSLPYRATRWAHHRTASEDSKFAGGLGTQELGTQTTHPPTTFPEGEDLLRWPVVGNFLRWRHSRTLLQIPLLLLSVVMILHGLLGTQIAPKNLATVLTWVHFRGALVLVLLCAGNFFCLACPFMLVRNAARKLFRPRFNWPQALR